MEYSAEYSGATLSRVEFYVDEVVSLPYTVSGTFSGVFSPVGTSKVVNVNRLLYLAPKVKQKDVVQRLTQSYH